MIDKEEFFSLNEAAEYAHVTRQAIYKALTHRGLKAKKIGRRWHITRKDLDEYRVNKYNRDNRVINGELVFDMDKGEFSVPQVCKVFSSTMGRPFPVQRLYYLLRIGQLKASRKGASWVIKKEDAIELLQEEMGKYNIIVQSK